MGILSAHDCCLDLYNTDQVKKLIQMTQKTKTKQKNQHIALLFGLLFNTHVRAEKESDNALKFELNLCLCLRGSYKVLI